MKFVKEKIIGYAMFVTTILLVLSSALSNTIGRELISIQWRFFLALFFIVVLILLHLIDKKK